LLFSIPEGKIRTRIKIDEGVPMIVNYDSAKITRPFPGVTRRVLAHSPQVMLTEHTLEKGAVLPHHNHPHEQLVHLLSGELRLEMEGQSLRVKRGDSLVIPSNVFHEVTAVEKSVALDIFVPRRDDYL
jgi:quercetin dioxygenase-like cupin family protein